MQIQALLPVRELCHAGGALVALWVTNRERIRRYVETTLLQAWGCVLLLRLRLCLCSQQLNHSYCRLELVAEWHWLKVAADGAPALPLRGAGAGCRRPYEPLLLARTATAGGSARTLSIPPRVVLLAPPGPHSRKPRLLRLLRPFAPASSSTSDDDVPVQPKHGAAAPTPPACALDACELFARELCADATSWGNEPLRFQLQAGPPEN